MLRTDFLSFALNFDRASNIYDFLLVRAKMAHPICRWFTAVPSIRALLRLSTRLITFFLKSHIKGLLLFCCQPRLWPLAGQGDGLTPRAKLQLSELAAFCRFHRRCCCARFRSQRSDVHQGAYSSSSTKMHLARLPANHGTPFRAAHHMINMPTSSTVAKAPHADILHFSSCALI